MKKSMKHGLHAEGVKVSQYEGEKKADGNHHGNTAVTTEFVNLLGSSACFHFHLENLEQC